ncbi:MAG: cofactor-independent phosphoglycerate mutase [Methanoregulaceae archaeon]|nr:cofactor-independent phosphoglycerate mutase [Methanoregulaceae archaeon]
MTPVKCLVVLGDGMADEPIGELGGLTPLEYAKTPNMDRIAREGATGMLRTVPPGFEAGSDIANLSILGYDPRTSYTGRGPLEAVSMGVELGPKDIAYRCNLSTVENGIMADFSSGHISSAEGASLLRSLQDALPEVMVRGGVSYRNLLVLPGGKGSCTYPPHDIVGQEIAPYLPSGEDAPMLLRCMNTSRSVFSCHPVNDDRKKRGLPPATQIWPWSGGRKPALAPFEEKYRRRGGVISAVDLLKGIARCAGLEVIDVPGATGYLDTDYAAKARYAVSALRRLDFLYLHVEAPDEAGHLGNVPEKVRAIERVDEMLGAILREFTGVVAVLPDHPTPIRCRTHTGDPVPFAVLGRGSDGSRSFSEREARSGSLGEMEATDLLPFLFGTR